MKEKIRTNPFGSNGSTSDPREQKMWDIYTKGIAKGIGNAKQAAIDAGYSEDHADNITLQGWFKGRKDKLRRRDMLSKAERNLEKVLDMDTIQEDKENPQLLRIKTDVSTTIAKTLGKKVYSERTELTGQDGEPLNTLTDEQADRILQRRIKSLSEDSK
jgi:hypothetical protein